VKFGCLEKVLSEKDTEMRLFGKPELKGHRRMGVLLARRDNVEEALEVVKKMRTKVEVRL
jgi:phosphoribosylglycinamide formyltransferase 2